MNNIAVDVPVIAGICEGCRVVRLMYDDRLIAGISSDCWLLPVMCEDVGWLRIWAEYKVDAPVWRRPMVPSREGNSEDI